MSLVGRASCRSIAHAYTRQLLAEAPLPDNQRRLNGQKNCAGGAGLPAAAQISCQHSPRYPSIGPAGTAQCQGTTINGRGLLKRLRAQVRSARPMIFCTSFYGYGDRVMDNPPRLRCWRPVGTSDAWSCWWHRCAFGGGEKRCTAGRRAHICGETGVMVSVLGAACWRANRIGATRVCRYG